MYFDNLKRAIQHEKEKFIGLEISLPLDIQTGLRFTAIETTGHDGTVDWGDGITESYNSATNYEHDFRSGTGIIKFDCEITTIKDSAFAFEIFSQKAYPQMTDIIIPKSVTSIGSLVFDNCATLTAIRYRGTEAEWNAIVKADDWLGNCTAEVICNA